MRVVVAAASLAVAVAGLRVPAPPMRVYFNQYQSPVMSLYVADADGSNEHALLGGTDLEYSPSYSSDGAWIVFTRERNGQSDLFRVHPDGSGIEQLTDDPAFDDQGTLSPDCKTLAFVSTRGTGTANLWLMDLATRKTRALTTGRSGNFHPVWSPDGRWIAFSSDRNAKPGALPGSWEQLQSLGIYLIAPDGSGLKRLTHADGVAGSPSWYPDSKRLVFYETDEVGAYLAKSSNVRVELATVDIATGKRVTVSASNETKLSPAVLSGGRFSYIKRSADTVTGGLNIYSPSAHTAVTVVHGAVRSPSWSPDGRHVVFQRLKRLGVTQHLMPTFNRDAGFELLMNEPFPELSPDGRRLLFSEYQQSRSTASGLANINPTNTAIRIMNADGSDQKTIFYREGFSSFDAVWSPKGDQVALAVGKYFRQPGPPPGQIALMKPDGSDFHLIVDDSMNNGFVSWSPDASRIVFKRGHHLVTMSLADHKIVPLTDGPSYDNFPQWSPKGDVILFTSDRDGQFNLYTIRPDGTGLRQLTNTPGNNAHAALCAGGTWVVFASGRMGFKDEMALYDNVPQPYGEIFAMRADGSDVHQLTDNKWEDASPSCRH